MKILNQRGDLNLVLNNETNFRLDLGREEDLKQFESETLRSLINPIENYETTRFIHKPYSGLVEQYDIWYYFYFYNNDPISSHYGGLDYSLAGIKESDNTKMAKETTNSFFRLEFYKIPDGEVPERSNRKLVFTKNFLIPSGENVYYSGLKMNLFVPVFFGSNYQNKENIYLFWFQDEEMDKRTVSSGNTFYMSARFFNSEDGSIINFGNNNTEYTLKTDTINEKNDLYYKVIIDRTDYTYQVFDLSNNRIGESGNPIKFFEISGG